MFRKVRFVGFTLVSVLVLNFCMSMVGFGIIVCLSFIGCFLMFLFVFWIRLVNVTIFLFGVKRRVLVNLLVYSGGLRGFISYILIIFRNWFKFLRCR